MTLPECPNCGSRTVSTRRRRREIRREIQLRTSFVKRRLDHKPGPAELMDLTRFMHGRAERLVSCAQCGLVLRDERKAACYETDFYDRDLLQHLYPRYLQAFQEKERNYRDLLPPRAEVIELGSHLGAFLETAEQWNWRPTGLDIGEHSSAFALSRGLRVKRESIEDTRFARRSADAVFIWNCFEQLENPAATLLSARSLLRPGGLVVVRTPNVEFYERCSELARARALRKTALRALAYNNLLGFPYLFGYTPRSLTSVVRRFGFEPVVGIDSTLLTIPFPNVTPTVQQEIAAAYRPYEDALPRNPAALSGPWIEIVGRRGTD